VSMRTRDAIKLGLVIAFSLALALFIALKG